MSDDLSDFDVDFLETEMTLTYWDQRREDAELDSRLELLDAEDRCREDRHDYRTIVACRLCGDAVHIPGVSGETPTGKG